MTQHQQTSTRDQRADRRFVDLEDLTCPGCGQCPLRAQPPGYWRVAWGLPVAQFSHLDATALCPRVDGTPADPVEIEAHQ